MKPKAIITTAIIVIIAVCVGIIINNKVLKPKRLIEQSRIEIEAIQSETPLRDGDIIFQNSNDKVGEYSKSVTGSDYSHLGIVFTKDGEFVVYEAADPISKITPIDEWIAKGKDGAFTVKRLKDADNILTSDNLQKLRAEADKYIGKEYDYICNWSDKRLYNAELVWKVYVLGLHVYLNELQALKYLNMDYPEFAAILKKEYPEANTAEFLAISPQKIFETSELYTVIKK